MSTLIVPVCKIDSIIPHPNADTLDICIIHGWQVVVKRGCFAADTHIVYFPPDSVLSSELSDRLGVTKYLSKGRVRSIKLRGEPSHGFAVPYAEFPELGVQADGTNVAELLKVTKYEPPVNLSVSNAAPDHPLFHAYTDIENYRNFQGVFTPDEDVIATEKIHGTNCRVGLVEEELMAGSHTLRRYYPKDSSKDIYWFPLSFDKVRKMLVSIADIYKSKAVILFCEVYGYAQDLRYGHVQGEISFAAFDLSVNGKYLDFADFQRMMQIHDIPTVPVIFRGKFSDLSSDIKKYAGGRTMLFKPVLSQTSDNPHMREGIVIKPAKEGLDPRIGRKVLKYISDEYLTRKGGTENH